MQNNAVATYANAVDAVYQAKQQLGIALNQFHRVLPEHENLRVFTLPSPGWWFILHAPSMMKGPLLDLVIPDGVPRDCHLEETFLIRADLDFNWGIVQEDSLKIVRRMGWRNRVDLWPDLYEMRHAAGKIVGQVTIDIEDDLSFHNAMPLNSPITLARATPILKGGFPH